MKLFCAFVGEGKRLISSVTIRGDESMAEVKESILTREGLTPPVCRPSSVRLYLAKQGGDVNGPWLESTGEDIDALFQIEMPAQSQQLYLRREQALDEAAGISKYFPVESHPILLERERIHLLVDARPLDQRSRSMSTVGDEHAQLPQRQRLFPLGWTQEVKPCPQLVFGADKFLRIPEHYLVGSGVESPQEHSDLLLYRRTALEKQWSEIQCHSLDSYARLWIVGAPGTGKSSAAYAFACGKVDRAQWDVLWIRCANASISLVQFQGDVKSTCVYAFRDDLTEVTVELDSLLHDANRKKKTLVFLDGYVQKANVCESVRRTLLHWQLLDPTQRRLVCVASMVSVEKIDDGKDVAASAPRSSPLPTPSTAPPRFVAPKVKRFHLVSWTLKEYVDAIGCARFYQNVRHNLDPTPDSRDEPPVTRQQLQLREEQVRRKYQVTGGSARFMFLKSREECIAILNRAMERVDDLKPILRGRIGTDVPSIVNTLLAHYLDPGSTTIKHRILSEYVARLAATKFGPDLILRYAQVLNANPSMDGHALEAWVFASVRVCGLDYYRRDASSHTPLRWKDEELSMFDPDATVSDVVSELLRDGWHVPTKWNQAGYDAVRTESCDGQHQKLQRVSFVQITRASTHSFKPAPFIALLCKLGWRQVRSTNIELVYAVPMEILQAFKEPVSREEFQETVIDKAFPRNKGAIQCEVHVVGVQYPMNHCCRYHWVAAPPAIDKLDQVRVDRGRGPDQELQPTMTRAAKRRSREPPKSAPLPTAQRVRM